MGWKMADVKPFYHAWNFLLIWGKNAIKMEATQKECKLLSDYTYLSLSRRQCPLTWTVLAMTSLEILEKEYVVRHACALNYLVRNVLLETSPTDEKRRSASIEDGGMARSLRASGASNGNFVACNFQKVIGSQCSGIAVWRASATSLSYSACNYSMKLCLHKAWNLTLAPVGILVDTRGAILAVRDNLATLTGGSIEPELDLINQWIKMSSKSYRLCSMN